MEYNLSSVEHMGETLTKLYKKYGKSFSHIYLLKAIIFKARYDEGKVFIDDEYVSKKVLEYQDIVQDLEKLSALLNDMLKKLESNPNDVAIESFVEFMQMANIDEKIQNIHKYHTKHKDKKTYFPVN